jgi:hypothetical protein
MDVRLPDGTIIRGVPDGTTREELTTKLKANGYNFDEPAKEPPASSGTADMLRRGLQMATPAGAFSALATPEGRQDLLNAGAGAIRGSGSIGATIVAPYDMAKDAIAGKGLSLESNRQRRADMDATLKDVGADPSSLMYQGGKIATEVGGTLGVGGGTVNVIGRVAPGLAKAAPGLMNAISSGGMTTGARVAPGFASQAVNLGTRVAGGAINGGLSAGLVNPEEAGVGAALGGVTPVVTKVAGAAGRAVGNAVSNRFATNNAAEKIAGAIGDDAAVRQSIADIETHFPKGAENIPASAAAITQNGKLAQLEQGSRLRSTAPWYEFDQRQGKAAFDNVMDATKEAGELGARKSARAQNWEQAWAKAEESQKPKVWARRMTQFGGDLEKAMQSPQSSNPEVRAVLESINAELDRVGPSFSPAHLQHIRANLNGKVQPMSTNVFKSAPRDNPAIISLKQELDDILNVSTGGKWQRVLEGYAKDSDAVRASAAAGKVRSAFVDEASGRGLGPSLNTDTPLVTEAGLGRAMNAARLPDKSLALSKDANARLEATLDALRRQNLIKGVKRSASAGGGSDTVPNEIAAGMAREGGAPSLLLQLAGAVRKMGTGKTDTQMARLLSEPDALARELERYLGPPRKNRLAELTSRALPAALTPD